jgi:hypothetical protein
MASRRVSRHIWSAKEIELLEQLYLHDKLSPHAIAKEVGGVTASQVSAKVSSLGWPRLKRLTSDSLKETELEQIATSNDEQVSVQHGDTYINSVVEKSQAAAEKAFQFAEESENPRDLNSAMQAAAKGVSLYRQSKGLDNTNQASGNTFNILYQSQPIKPIDI